MTLAIQGLVFATMLLLGVFTGVWADFLRFATRKCNKLIIAITDLFFWATVFCVFLLMLFKLNYLELRLYAFFSMGLGSFIYYRFFSSRVLRIISWAAKTAAKLAGWLRCISQPLLMPFRGAAILLDRGILCFFSAIARAAIKIKELISSREDIRPTT